MRGFEAYGNVCGFLVFVTLLVCSRFLVERRPLGIAESLPALTENLADLAWSERVSLRQRSM